jgi:hypothetical protein
MLASAAIIIQGDTSADSEKRAATHSETYPVSDVDKGGSTPGVIMKMSPAAITLESRNQTKIDQGHPALS